MWFLSNAEEEQKLSTQEYQEKLAMAIKEGIKNIMIKGEIQRSVQSFSIWVSK